MKKEKHFSIINEKNRNIILFFVLALFHYYKSPCTYSESFSTLLLE